MTRSPRIHPQAVCEAAEVGMGTSVEAFALVAADCVLGDDCTVGGGAQILTGARLGKGSVVGENAVVQPGIVVARGSVVEAGSVVADPVPPNAIVRGNPARIIGYVGGDAGLQAMPRVEHVARLGDQPTRIRNASVHRLTRADDLRGSLMAADFASLPFAPTRIFTVSDVPSEHIRGSHAHRECAQLLVCVRGSLNVVLDDGVTREEFVLEDSEFGLHVPPMSWSTQYKYSLDATLLVLASHPYDPADYIRDYDEFLRLVEESS